MCFTVNVNIVREELEKRFNTTFIDPDNYRPSYYYHAYSLPDLPVAAYFDGQFNIRLLRWGLIPSWTAGAEEAQKIRYMTFNARAETLATKPAYSDAFAARRCIIPVKGFFEWQHKGGAKTPWYIYSADSGLMSLAGLYDRWRDPETDNSVYTFTVITSEANKLMSEIHNTKKRMPLILQDDQEDKWLKPGAGEDDLAEILKAYPDDRLKAHTVSPMLGDTKINRNRPELIKPYTYPRQSTLF
ncbi:MAG: SOS response-associated peptidase [Bacteroidales bacterium]|nr:SOS response-associated peptidase [Bacteroidales bacterium]